MKLSYNWLKEILPNLKIRPEKLAEVLNMHVAEVEKVEKLSQGLEKVITAEIVKIKPHPNADKLQIAVVNTGKENKKIVCGAPNIQVGQKVPLALPGAKLIKGTEIKQSIIRGIKSQGMLCAEDELGIGPDHEGIYILPEKTKLGQPVIKVLGLNDTIIEVENKSITRRPDLFNHLGFAREISAVLGIKSKVCPVKSFAESKRKSPILFNRVKDFNLKEQKSAKKPLEVKVQNSQLCPRYMAVVMQGIKVKSSPEWMQIKLRNLGLRPINNVVDITNYVLMEFGQPLHAFDFNKVSGMKIRNPKSLKGEPRAIAEIRNKSKIQNTKQIVIRNAKNGEKLLALDGKEYELSVNDLVIADSKKPVALAGVMGGELSGVTETTKTIIIESANFDPVCTRRTSWRLGLRTDSALRFEKGLPINFPEAGMRRAIELVQKLAHGQVVSQIYDLKSQSAIKKIRECRNIAFDFDRARSFIGLEIKNEVVKRILKSLGCQIKAAGKKIFVSPPVYRPDLNIFEDLVEEVIRIYGTRKIPLQPILGKLEPCPLSEEFVLEKKIKNVLIGCGFDEIYNYSFYSKETIIDNIKKSRHLEILNPLNPEQQYLRTSLIPGLLKNIEKNSKNFSRFKIFEVGRVFAVEEKKKVAGLVFRAGKNLDSIIENVVELIFDKLNIDKKRVKYQTGKSNAIDICSGKDKLGYFAVLQHDKAVFELDFEKLIKSAQGAKKYQSIPDYPPIKRDLAFLVDKNITWEQIKQTIIDIDPLIQNIELFDVFDKDKKFGSKKNIAFHIIYQSFDKTLKGEEIDKIQKKIIKTLKENFKARLRDF